MTSEIAVDLSIREMYDLLVMTNKIIEVGQEFGADDPGEAR